MRQAVVSEEQTKLFEVVRSTLPGGFRPLIRPTLESQAGILGIQPELLRPARTRGDWSLEDAESRRDR